MFRCNSMLDFSFNSTGAILFHFSYLYRMICSCMLHDFHFISVVSWSFSFVILWSSIISCFYPKQFKHVLRLHNVIPMSISIVDLHEFAPNPMLFRVALIKLRNALFRHIQIVLWCCICLFETRIRFHMIICYAFQTKSMLMVYMFWNVLTHSILYLRSQHYQSF